MPFQDDKKENQDAYSIRANFCSSSAVSSSLNNDTFLAVYDGHGRYGDKCSSFAKAELPILIERAVHRVVTSKKNAAAAAGTSGSSSKKKQKPSTTSIASPDGESRLSSSFSSPSSLSYLSKEEFQAACRQAHLECNKMMHKTAAFDDSLSGTTAISVTFHSRDNKGTDITVCNVGDSRAILGQMSDANNASSGGGGGTYKAIPLSLDQTPYRRDERRRIKATGARIMSLDQIEGLEPLVESDDEDDEDVQLGETIDEGGDPPRVWAPNGEYPGTAFTRSLGDLVAEKYGVHAEPEIITRPLSPEDKIIVLASDGVTEFLTNQSVVDICAKFNDPLEACRAVVAESYELWLQYELRTDDITMICVFIDGLQQPEEEVLEKEKTLSTLEPKQSSIRSIASSQAEALSDSERKIETLPKESQKPARCEMSKKARIELDLRRQTSSDDVLCAEEEIDIKALVNAKSEDDKARISEAIKASVIFNDITDEQKEMICSAMEHVDVKKGDWVIRQGEMGDRLYVVEEGEFEVRVLEKGRKDDGTGGSPVHVYFGSRSQHAHPTFGEIALRHSVPRQSSVIALTDGQLWALHRVVFNKILCYHNSRKEARHYLRKLSAFRMLTQDELQIVVDNLEEVSYAADQVIVEQGELGDAFYFIVKGSCGKSTKLFLYYGLLFISYMCCTGLFFVLSFHSFNLYYGRSDCE
jgi:serine/threonine protein phosphatase PrpC/CRP-like cAMP-binding protein